VDDIIPAPAEGCPIVTSEPDPEVTSEPNPEITSEPNPEVTSEPTLDTITVCHSTGSATNPYVEITVSYNAAAEGHGHNDHLDDIIPMPAEGCPLTLWAGGLNPLLLTVSAPSALTPITLAEPVCVDWLVYSTNITGDWEIFRLGELLDNPNADANLTKVVGQYISDIAPSLSPDHRWLTFSSNRGGSWEIYVGSTDGTVQQRVTQTGAQNSNPAWSPTGQYIAFESNRDGNWGLFMVDVTTGVETRLTYDTASYINPSWSPDGTHLLFQSDRGGGMWQIYELNIATMDYLLRSGGQGDDFDPSYSDDGNWIVFRSLRDVNSVVYMMNRDGSGVTRISDSTARALNPVWSPDNSLVVYQSDLGGDMEIHVYEMATGLTRQVTDNLVDDYAPTWVCDSPTLVFTSDVDGNPNIFSTSALPMAAAPVSVPDQAVRMTTDIAVDRYPVASPGESHASLVGDR
jgi:Tol biopolymer transport system component